MHSLWGKQVVLLFFGIQRLCGKFSTQVEVYGSGFRPIRLTYLAASVVITTTQLMLYKDVIAICSETYVQHTNSLCWQYVQFSFSDFT
jgi:hypothetical protein